MTYDIELEYSQQEDQQEVLAWLKENITVARLSKHGYTGFDGNNQYVWRMALKHGDRRVLFNCKDAAMLFQLSWC
jgi:hypothetical protein